MYIASQIIVVIANIILICSLQVKTKVKLLIIQSISCFLFSLHYFLQFAYLGGALELIDVVRQISFYFLDKSENKKYWTYGACATFVGLSIMSAILTWDVWYCIFPLLGAILVIISLAQKNLTVIKGACTIHSICSCIYMFLIASYAGAAFEVLVLLGSAIGFVIQFYRDKRNKNNPLQSFAKATKQGGEKIQVMQSAVVSDEKLKQNSPEGISIEKTAEQFKKDKNKKNAK